MVFGGSFSPMHMGHVKAAQNAIRLLRESGYNVRKLIMCPSPDKILVEKLGDTAYSLEDRVELGKLSVQGLKDIEVSGDAASEAEKLRRTNRFRSTPCIRMLSGACLPYWRSARISTFGASRPSGAIEVRQGAASPQVYLSSNEGRA